MQVDFFVAGVQKGGTTALDAMLRQHPAIAMARNPDGSPLKEVHFFDDETIDWSAPDYSRLHAAFDQAETRLRGEATPIYVYWPKALERLAAYNPNAKIIVGLRHPTFRAYAQWRMETRRITDTWSFSDAIRGGRDRVVAAGGAHPVFSYVERGFYDEQCERLLVLFPRSRVHFFRSDHLFAEPAKELSALFAFLGVPMAPIVGGYVSGYASDKPVAPLKAEDRAFLDALYAPRYARVEALTGLDLSDWRDPGYREPMAAD